MFHNGPGLAVFQGLHEVSFIFKPQEQEFQFQNRVLVTSTQADGHEAAMMASGLPKVT
ncbi:hypothetical protein PGTUg99_023088 [Puccinia graminis f. sp. tritici]|uniref:Uncharacterized protein n=1 Tax=Puccinia graminis f. sp. tritici TaxID=56615 RepID=A0A5B0S574_PUCGR|nr:hypothetical protein PGTUg99_023088 [Puccinia graminis f. sp. tritici]